MNMLIESKRLLTKRALDRAEELIMGGRAFQGAPTDVNFVKQTDLEYRDELVLWFERQRGRYFTRDEMTLQCVVALRYADPTRPTVRELWQYLQVLIRKDARALPGRRPMRLPSYSTFRGRVADLPRGFVWKTRSGRDDGRPSIASMVLRFEAVTSNGQ